LHKHVHTLTYECDHTVQYLLFTGLSAGFACAIRKRSTHQDLALVPPVNI